MSGAGKPATSSASSASSRGIPSTVGSRSIRTPSETRRVTSPPRTIGSPGPGSVEMTSPAGTSSWLARSTSTPRSLASSVDVASDSVIPTTGGVGTSEPGPSRNHQAAPPAAASTRSRGRSHGRTRRRLRAACAGGPSVTSPTGRATVPPGERTSSPVVVASPACSELSARRVSTSPVTVAITRRVAARAASPSCRRSEGSRAVRAPTSSSTSTGSQSRWSEGAGTDELTCWNATLMGTSPVNGW